MISQVGPVRRGAQSGAGPRAERARRGGSREARHAELVTRRWNREAHPVAPRIRFHAAGSIHGLAASVTSNTRTSGRLKP